MKKRVRVVIVGAGAFGTKRLSACLAMPKIIEVVAVVDPSARQRDRISDSHHVLAVPDFQSLTKKADLAIIATPNVYHTEMSITAMRHNMHVLCEKPLATTLADAKKIIAASKKYKRIVKTGSNHRFFHTVEKAKELFDQGKIGKLLFFKGSIGIDGSKVSRNWLLDPATAGGGTFIDNGCHLLDMARMFMGNFTRCTAVMTNNLWKEARVEDVGSAIYMTKDNRQAIITTSWLQWAGYSHIELWGEKGYIITDSTTHDTVTIGGKDGIFTTFDYSNEKKDSYHRELLYLASCIQKNKQPNPDAADGAAVISMVEAAYKASKKKTWVHIT